VPLLLGSAVRPLQFDGPAHDLVAVTPDDDITDIIRRCVAALDDGRVKTEAYSEITDSEALEDVEHGEADGIRPRPRPRREPTD
jgi:hypothetical protein